ncbi:MAG: hypothetical protein MJ148_01095 [Clostridia bacterium]|nr:hypothetical protein [Clostridia bacterium]
MELQINDLVSAIKKDGIETAQKEAAEIISKAKEEAEAIITNAKSEAAKLKEASEKEIKIFEDSARVSAEQAKRDAVLAVKAELNAEFDKLLKADVNKALDDKLLAKHILAAVSGENVADYAVELKSVSESLEKELAGEIKKGLELRVSKMIKGGFKIAAKDGSGYFDCSDEELANILAPFFRDVRL